MYVDPFVMGVLVTIGLELVGLVALAIRKMIKK